MMRKLMLILIALIYASSAFSQASDEQEKNEILTILNAQAAAWSNNNIEGFMEGYWKSDSLKFYGSAGLTYGWKNTLHNYKKRYPTKEHTGTLHFKVHAISKIMDGAYYVMGDYFLKRKVGDANGIFMVVFKRIHGAWKIIADTSC